MRSFDTLQARGQMQRLRHLAYAVLGQYAIEVAHLALLQYRDNAVFRATTARGEHFVVRIHAAGHYLPAEIQAEVDWLRALRHDTDLQVPEPVPAADGSFVVTMATPGIPERRTCVVFRWIRGRFLRPGPPPAALGRLGEWTARLHEHGLHWYASQQVARPRWDWQRFFGPTSLLSSQWGRLRLTDQERQLVGEIAARVGAEMQRLDRSSDAFGLIHADLHQANYLFDHGQVGVIDFEDCGPGYHLFDMATTLLEIAHPLDEPARYAASRDAYLAGYSAVRPVGREIEQQLLVFTTLRLVFLMNWVVHTTNPNLEAEARSWLPWAVNDLHRYLAVLAT